MSKNPNTKLDIKQIIKVSQSIEGYTTSTNDSVKIAKDIMEKYEIKVSVKRK